MKLTKEQLTEVIQTIYARAAEGKLDQEIMDELNISAQDYAKLKASMFDQKADEIRGRPTEHTYIQYMLDQAQNVTALTDMIQEFKNTKQYNAMVGAIRARSEIYDKLIDKGQQFGLIHREPDKKQVMGGLIVADLSNKQLKTMITGELSVLDKLMRQYGDKNIMDMVPGSLHRGPALKEATSDSAVMAPSQKKPTKSTKSSNHRRSGGRKVVKQKAR